MLIISIFSSAQGNTRFPYGFPGYIFHPFPLVPAVTAFQILPLSHIFYRSPWHNRNARSSWSTGAQYRYRLYFGETQSVQPGAHVSSRHGQAVGGLQFALCGGARKSTQPGPGWDTRVVIISGQFSYHFESSVLCTILLVCTNKLTCLKII